MKKMLLLLAVAGFFSCQSNPKEDTQKDSIQTGLDKVGEGLQQTADSTGAYLAEQKKQAQDAINKKINDIDKSMEELKKDGSEKSKKAMQKLEEQKVAMNKKLNEVKNSSAEAWDETKKGVNNLLDKSDKEWQEFKKDFKNFFRKDS